MAPQRASRALPVWKAHSTPLRAWAAVLTGGRKNSKALSGDGDLRWGAGGLRRDLLRGWSLYVQWGDANIRGSAQRSRAARSADAPTEMWVLRGSNHGCSNRCADGSVRPCPRTSRDTGARLCEDSKRAVARWWPLTRAEGRFRLAQTTTEIWRSGAACFS